MNAYLDPGSGSMLLGLFASGLAGIVVVFKTFGHRVVSTLAFWRKDEDISSGGVAEDASSGGVAEDASSGGVAEAVDAPETEAEPESAPSST
jgi:hypothetical protein